MVMVDYAHLQPATRPFAAEDAQSRIRRIRTDRWIAYARAKAVLAALEDLLTFPKRLRMPNLLLVGPTNNGKTMIVEKFRRAHASVLADETDAGAAIVPVLKIQMPAGPDEGRFFGAILDALGMPYGTRDRVATKQDTAVRIMRATGARLLVIDELHNLLSGTALQQRRLLNVLRWLGNELQIPLVGVGTPEALRAIRSDEQLVNRFEPFALPLWTDDEEYRRLLSTLEAVLPLRKPSQATHQMLLPTKPNWERCAGWTMGSGARLFPILRLGCSVVSHRLVSDACCVFTSDGCSCAKASPHPRLRRYWAMPRKAVSHLNPFTPQCIGKCPVLVVILFVPAGRGAGVLLKNQAALIAEFAFLFAQAVFHLLWIRNVIGAKSEGVGRASGSLLRGP
jgi:hypothetical protein